MMLLFFCFTHSFAQNGSWSTKAPMNAARWAEGIGEYNGSIIVAGGYNPLLGSHLSSVEIYDISTNTWTVKTSRPSVQTAPSSGVVNGILYTAGGSDMSLNTPNLTSYSFATGIWTAKKSHAFPHGNTPAGGIIDGHFFIAGGRSLDGSTFTSSLEEYNPVTDTWITRMPMNTPRSGTGSAVINGLLYVVGGRNSSGTLATLEVYDPVMNAWQTKTPMPTPRFDLSAASINGILYAVGGNNGAHLGVVEAYDPFTDKWRTETQMPTARTDARAVAAKGKLYVIGGYNSVSTPLSTVEEFTPPVPSAAGHWMLQNSTTTKNLVGVHFVDKSQGFACGDNGTILKTIDGGVHWSGQTTGVSANLTQIQFISPLIGYAASYSGDGGTFIKSTDGGTTWYDFSLKTSDTRSGGFWFFSGDTGFLAVGNSAYSSSKILRTVNGGISWDTVLSGNNSWISYLNFPDRTRGYATASNGNVLRTTDGGSHWMTVGTGSGLWMSGIHFFDKDNGFAGGGDFNTGGGTIYKTTNGGTNWQTMTVNYGASIIRFVSATTGFAIGSNSSWNVKKVILTADGGASWSLDPAAKERMNDLTFPNVSTGYAVGDSGVIMKYAAPTAVTHSPDVLPGNFVLRQNYPNPFNPTTTINYQIPAETQVNLSVYDLLGRVVITIVDGVQQEGMHSEIFNGSSLSSGIYFYRLRSGEYVQTHRMVLLK
ncbi:MAG: Kelch repeat-containing protein [Bacteroidota bacterium]